jgi:hypothetical protein
MTGNVRFDDGTMLLWSEHHRNDLPLAQNKNMFNRCRIFYSRPKKVFFRSDVCMRSLADLIEPRSPPY